MSKNTITNPLQKCEKYDKDPLRPADARRHLQKGGAALRSNDEEGLFYFEVLYLLTWAACRCKPGCRHQRTGSGH